MKNLLTKSLLALILPLGSVSASSETEAAPVVIIGGGVGALTSALYLSRAGIEPIVLEGKIPGGLLTQSTSVQNWPGEMEIVGMDLTDKLRSQAEKNGARFFAEEVVAVDFSKRPFKITTRSVGTDQKRVLQAETCIIAMGTQSNYLGIPGETGPNGYWGKGVSNCAVCDVSLFRDKVVGIVGGGDAAVLEALYLSNIAKEVKVFIRKSEFKGLEEKRREALFKQPNVKIYYNTVVEEIKGDGSQVKSVAVRIDQKQEEIPLDGLFLAIGSKPNSEIFQGVLSLDKNGYIQLEKDQETSIEGVYAVGDIVDPVYKQAISAAGDGAKAAIQAQKYISEHTTSLLAKRETPAKKEPPIHGEVVEVTSVEQFEKELKSGVPIIVDFYATWCGPCRRISPLFDESAGHLGGKVRFLKVNVDMMRSLSRQYQISSMPTALVFDEKGELVQRHVGTGEIANLLQSLDGN